SDTTPLLNGSSQDRMFETMAVEIEQLLGKDYTHEFHKTKANFLAIRERENLLGSVRKDIESYKSGSGVNNRRTELFLKEHEHLRK
ncbi:UNVERIFIED_CONTAM: hypothetical protein H355_017000, partial [Colinus virginianus]